MSTLGTLLCAAGFSDRFLKSQWQHAEFPLETRGTVTILEQRDIQDLVLQDFGKQSEVPCWVYQQADTAEAEEEVTDPVEEATDPVAAAASKTHCWRVGPGLYPHPKLKLWVLQEFADLKQNSLIPGLHTVRRVALLTTRAHQEAGMDLREYLRNLQTERKKEEKLQVFITSENQWMFFNQATVPSDSLFVGPVFEKVRSEVARFLSPSTRAWYHQHGITYARSLLFYGPPGNGKSKCIRVLGSLFRKPLYILNLNDARLTDDSLIQLVREVADGAFLVMEDIDRVFDHFSTNVAESHISFATLLNVLDGTLTREGVITIMTANQVDHMDDALKRCGRISTMHHFEALSAASAKAMFLSFYPGATEAADAMVKEWRGQADSLSGALLQEHLIAHRDAPAADAGRLLIQPLQKKRKRTQHNMVA
jgi:hypothetical protein